MVTGSMAMNFYATPRMTRDIDIVVELREADVARVVSLFQGEYYIDRDIVEQAIRNRSMFNMIHNDLVVKVDCVVRKESEYRREEFTRRRTLNLDGKPITVVTPEDLILSKLEWTKDSHSPMQLDDVRNMLRSVKNLDQAYLTRWVDHLGLAALYREVRA
ncbi:MAG: hypothetical protein HC794_06035 [Nitrospiraceae bacterium]|nr:hypothetical protein [Nitrospiraceae bacterium]